MFFSLSVDSIVINVAFGVWLRYHVMLSQVPICATLFQPFRNKINDVDC